MSKYKVGIIGCGSIFNRHLESIKNDDNFKLISICDINSVLSKTISNRLEVSHFVDYKEMILSKKINFIVILTPNSLHYEQAKFALENGCDVLIEKPVCFNPDEVLSLSDIANKNNKKAYCVLQVRLNPTVQIIKKVLESNLLGNIRGVSFVQRWQRPLEYFSGWRAEPLIGGGTLYECGIHYIDIIQYLFGIPKVISSKLYKVKHKSQLIEDTIYSIFDFENFGGTCEVTIAAEPQNIETSISIIGSNGYIKVGGKALNIIESYNFLSNGSKVIYENLIKDFPYSKEPNSYGSYQGSCPNHPDVYRNLEEFELIETYNVIKIIDDIYKLSNVKYY
jgi:UDP-N-acetyl-2-amino-2-deoxyglucuronate dehydrogenase